MPSVNDIKFSHNSEINSMSNVTGFDRYIYFRKENTMIRHISKALCLTLILILTPGCGLTTNQKAATTRFSAATIDLSSLAAAEFVNTRNDVIEMNTLRRQLGDEVQPIDWKLTLERTKIRVETVNALKEYGQLLHTLTTSSQDEELKNAAESCVASLKKVDGVSLDDTQAGAIVQAVQSVGGLWIEQMRKKATLKVVEYAHPHVTKLADLMIQSFDPEDINWSYAYNATVEALKGAPTLPNVSKTLASQATSMAELKKDRFATVSEKIIDAARNVRSAHDNLHNVLHYDEISTDDIDNLVVKIEEFITIYNILQEK